MRAHLGRTLIAIATLTLATACDGGGNGGGGASPSPPSNVPPVASFAASPLIGTAPVTVQFDASTSTDGDGSIASYDWNFGDNSPAGSGVAA